MNKKIKRRLLPDPLPSFSNCPSFLSRIYAARGIRSEHELDLSLKRLATPGVMKGVDEAVSMLTHAFYDQSRVMIVGDFDADGATSTALAVRALTEMGLRDCRYLVPNRFEYGYGLSPEIVDLAAAQRPELIITVDNGISSIEGVARAQSLGIKVIITDHHLPGRVLPTANAIVNPNQPGCNFLSKNAAGVGVIFYVLSCLKTALKQRKWFVEQGLREPNMADYLDLVALGTVADLVPLDENNRILVDQGLKRIRAGHCRPGIKAILAVAKKGLPQVSASDMGFLVGPRLNAAGRLDDMSIGIECLLARSDAAAVSFAERLDALNKERRSIEDEMRQDAEVLLKNLSASDKQADRRWGVSLYEPHWHQGVIGILASRIKEKLHRPIVIFAPESDDPHAKGHLRLKGSARSIPGFHMRDGLDLLATRYPELLNKFGGHAMAAGMTIERQDFDRFQLAFDQVVRDTLDPILLEPVLETDGELSDGELSLSTIESLQRAGPWGQQFPEPKFDGQFRVIQKRVLKGRHLKLVLVPRNSDVLFDAIAFNTEWVEKPVPEDLRIVYRPNINEFRGNRTVQLLIDYLEPA